jgi:hypothetical protein
MGSSSSSLTNPNPNPNPNAQGAISTIITKPDIIGLVSFFDFLCAVISRIAYTDAPLPLFLLSGVFRIIPPKLLEHLSKIKTIDNQNEESIYDLTANPDGFPVRVYNGKKCIDFMSYVKEINILIENTLKSPFYKQETDPNIKIISVADSNYGDALVIGVKYLPNFIFVAFRGTYSTKTMASYTRPDSVIPIAIDAEGQIKLLKGIAKITFEIMHTIIDASKYIVSTFLNSSEVIPVFTGHSLGGAMATILDLEYCKRISAADPGSVLLPKSSICVSFGAPRALGKLASETLCKYAVDGLTIVHRYSNDGDPITSLPPPGLGFYHPCSSAEDKKSGNRKLVSRDCKSSIVVRPLPRSEYTKPINCRDVEPSSLTKAMNAAPNIADHTTYSYVSFIKAADIAHLLIGSAVSWSTTEIGRVQKDDATYGIKAGDSELRIVQMTGNGLSGIYTIQFADLAKLREKQSVLHEDVKDTGKVFMDLVTGGETQVEFNNGLPIAFKKNINDNGLEDESNNQYIEDVKNAIGPSYAQEVEGVVVGGKRTKKRTKKSKRKSNKGKKKSKIKRNKKSKKKTKRRK